MADLEEEMMVRMMSGEERGWSLQQMVISVEWQWITFMSNFEYFLKKRIKIIIK